MWAQEVEAKKNETGSPLAVIRRCGVAENAFVDERAMDAQPRPVAASVEYEPNELSHGKEEDEPCLTRPSVGPRCY